MSYDAVARMKTVNPFHNFASRTNTKRNSELGLIQLLPDLGHDLVPESEFVKEYGLNHVC